MRKTIYSLFLTAVFGMLGMNASAEDVIEITNAQELAEFAEQVNGGDFEANAILKADIDMSALESWTAIGDWGGISGTASACYKGHFDGQGHTIKNFNFTSTHNYYGVFGVVSTGCLIENFTIYGTMNLGHKTGGVVGYTRDATPTIRNIHSYMTINVTEAATSAQRPGGIVGSAVNGTTVVENCTYSGTLNVGGHTGNIGGIVGYVNNNTAAIVNITNCLFDGKILNGTSAEGQCGGIVGYNNSGVLTVKNCLSIGTITSKEGNIGQFIGRLNGSNTKFYNNYYVGEFVNGTASGKTAGGDAPVKVTAAQLVSGEIAFALNGNQAEDVNWFQTLSSNALTEVTYTNVEYVATVNGDANNPQTQTTDITVVDNGDNTINFVLTNFAVTIQGISMTVPDIALENVPATTGEDGLTYFDQEEGTFTIPYDKLPAEYKALVSLGWVSFENIPYTLHGKKNDAKLYCVLDVTVEADVQAGGTKEVHLVAGEDNFGYPTPYGTDVVYPAGQMHCDGTAYEGVTGYSNTPASQDDHDFADGFCTYCDALDVEYMTANDDGFFEIGTPNQLRWFAAYVNQVNPAVNAILTADIDLEGIEWTPIGKSVYFGGTFDGKDFTISNLSYTGSGDCNGLFGGVKNATVKNFSINGSLVCAGSWTGAIGRAENATISNVHSSLTIETPATGEFHHAAGVVGGSYNPTTIDRCSFSGTLTVNADSHDCFGGIAGYITDYCTISNCGNYGTISFAKNNCYAGGIVGYINSTSCNGAHNCLNVGTVEYTGEGDPTYSGAIVGRLRGNNPDLWGNSYYKAGSAVNANGENQIPTNYEATDAQLASGEIAYKLGEAWGQEIGVDDYPVLDGMKVYELAGSYVNLTNIETAQGDADIILPAKKYGGAYDAYTYVAQADYEYGDWNTSNPNYNVIIGTPAEQDGKAWYTPGYNVTEWNYGQDLPNFGNGKPADVYALRFFTVAGEIPSTLYMPAPHDDAPCEYYINGELVWSETDGWYEDEVVRLTDEQKALIKTDGTVNVFAFHVHQNWGGRYADGGLYNAGAPVDAFNNDVAAIDATIALAETEGIDEEVVAFAKAKSNYRGGMSAGIAQLRKARRLAFDARTEDFTGSEPADGMIAYILNVGAKMFLAGGNDWGTHASLNHMGAKCVLHASGENYAIQTNLPNGTRGNNDWLGWGGYVDAGSPEAWAFEPAGDGTYHIINTNNSGANIYLGMTDDERLQVDTDKAGADNDYNKWIFVTPEEFLALAENATPEAPVDLGHLVHQATFSQNDFDGNDKWASNCTAELGDSKWDRNAGGIWGWKENWTGDMMFEMWNTKDVGKVWLVQEVEGLPAGKYTVQMNGYYRDGNFESADEGNVRQLAYLYAGSEENCVPLASIVDGSGNYPGYGRGGSSGIVIPDGCGDAARFFQVGTYVNTIEVQVGVDGKLKIGIFRDAEDVKGGDWITTDNWRLYYQGRSIDATITEAGYATFVAPWNISVIPEGVEASAAQVNKNKEGFVHLEGVTAIPAGEAVVLKGAEGTYTFFGTSEAVELGADNDLIAATAEVEADGTQYILAVDEEGPGFAKATPATKIPAGKGYLVITESGAKPFYPFGDSATGIAKVENTIDGVIYNVAGQRLQKMQKGIYIVNGKKIAVK